MDEKLIRFELVFSRRQITAALALALLAIMPISLGSETLTLTTYYPAPVGIYQKLTTTQQTVLARDGGNVVIGSANPAAKLEVHGILRVGNFASDPAGAQEGAIYYNTAGSKFMGYKGGQWQELGGSVVSGSLVGMCSSVQNSALGCTVISPPAFCISQAPGCQCPSEYTMRAVSCDSGGFTPACRYACFKN